MRYSYEFKRKCIDLYRQGRWPDTSVGINDVERFRRTVRECVRIEDSCVLEALRHKNQNKEWTAEERYELVAKVIAGQSCTSVAISSGINSGQLYQWVRKYKTLGYSTFEKFPSVEGLIFHSGQGWQYQHEYFRNTLKEHIIIQSMSRKGNCIDNCIMEAFFGRLKNEMYYGYAKDYDSFKSFAKAMEEDIRYYNNERIQKKTKWMPPVKYRDASMCT